MATDLASHNSAPSRSANGTEPATEPATSLGGNDRRYVLVELPDGQMIRLRSLKRSEVGPKLRVFDDARQMDALIALAWVDDHGDTCMPCTEEGFVEHLDDMDFRQYEALFESVKGHCRCNVDFDQMVKNS